MTAVLKKSLFCRKQTKEKNIEQLYPLLATASYKNWQKNLYPITKITK